MLSQFFWTDFSYDYGGFLITLNNVFINLKFVLIFISFRHARTRIYAEFSVSVKAAIRHIWRTKLLQNTLLLAYNLFLFINFFMNAWLADALRHKKPNVYFMLKNMGRNNKLCSICVRGILRAPMTVITLGTLRRGAL